jgi:hypothetical protein
VELLVQPTEPDVPTDEELRQAGRDVVRDIWGGKEENCPGTEEWFAKQKREGSGENDVVRGVDIGIREWGDAVGESGFEELRGWEVREGISVVWFVGMGKNVML